MVEKLDSGAAYECENCGSSSKAEYAILPYRFMSIKLCRACLKQLGLSILGELFS